MTTLRIERIEVTGFDGAKLAATLLLQDGALARVPRGVPLVLLPGHMKPAATLEPLARLLLERLDGPAAALLIDYRGRGRSDPRADASLYSPRAEAQDVVSVLDGLNWHHADVIGSARGGLVAMCLTAARPALIRRLVLNDIGPEVDGVGIARLRMAAARMKPSNSWDNAVATLREQNATRFPALTDADYELWARGVEEDVDGKPQSRVDAGVYRHFASIDADERYPTLWDEFRALRSRPVLLMRAEHSDALNDEIVSRMQREHPALTIEPVPGQGHAPLLHLGNAAERIGRFLSG